MNRNFPYILLISLFSLSSLLALPGSEAEVGEADAVGIWLSQNGEEKVEIYQKGGKYYGKVVWMAKPYDELGKLKTDILNPDPEKRNQPYIGLEILSDFEYVGHGVFKKGKVYDAGAGKTYSGIITLVDKHTAKMRGYMGIPLIGKTEISTKVTTPVFK